MKIFLGLLIFLTAQNSFAGQCENLVKKLDSQAQPTNPVIKIGQLSFSFISPAPNKASSCSISVSYPAKNRSYVFSDDGMIGVSDRVNTTGLDSKDTRFKSYMLLPQEKQKDFSISRDKKMVTIHMHSGDIVFDTDQGKIVSGTGFDITDSSQGLKVTNPKALWIDFGSNLGKDPKDVPGLSATVSNENRSCQFKKAGLLEKVKWDQVMRLQSQSQQLDFFKKECPGTKFSLQPLQKSSLKLPADLVLEHEGSR
jgi:hypothetical protein